MPTAHRRVIRFINAAHFVVHWFMLIFPTAVLGMESDFGRPFGELIALSLGGFIAFGAGSLPAGWLGDRWSRRNMMALYFIGIGLAAAATGLAETAWQLAAGLTAIGLFASIYHPVGTAMLVSHAELPGRAIGVNGVWGNLGVASAALLTGAVTQWIGWRWAFALPGAAVVLMGLLYLRLVPDEGNRRVERHARDVAFPRPVVVRAFAVMALVTLSGGVVFTAVTLALPKLFAERLSGLSGTFSVGLLVFGVYAIGAMSQLIIGRMIDRHPLKACFLPLALWQAPLLGLAAIVQGWVLVPVAAAMVFVMFGQVTINDGMVARYAAADWRARVYAVRYLLSFGVSACAVPLVAATHDRGGFHLLFVVLAVFGAVTFAGALAFPYRRDELQTATAPRLAAAPRQAPGS